MQEKILITGAKGQLGLELTKLLPQAILTDTDTLDITNYEDVESFIHKYQITTIINCAAYTAVDKAEDDKETAYAVNVVGPENLAKTGCKLIHISTDYVFDGHMYRPYTPDDKPNPLSVYGITKEQGEQAVLKYAQNAVIIRTAWLYSANGQNFVKTMRRLGCERTKLNVVCDQIGTPTFAGDLAQVIVDILPQMTVENKGIYHYTNEGVCSWYDFATAIMVLSHLNCQVAPILSSEYPTKAIRPFYSVLDKTKIKNTFHLTIPHWKESLVQCLKQF